MAKDVRLEAKEERLTERKVVEKPKPTTEKKEGEEKEEEEEKLPPRSIFVALFFFVFLDVLGFSIILPLLPFLAETFDASSNSQIGWLVSSNAIAQFIAVPIIGTLSDQIGRRPLLLLCTAGTFLSFAILSQANSLSFILLSRVVDGLLGGNISLAQTYMSDVTPESYRTRGMGILGAALGLGFIFGPAFGAFLYPDYVFAASITCFLSLLNFFGIYFLLPESLDKKKVKGEKEKEKEKEEFHLFPFKTIWHGFSDNKMRPVLLSRFTFGLILTFFETFVGLILFREFGFQPKDSGLVLTSFALIYAITQSRLLSLIRLTKEKKVILFSFLSLFFSMILFSFSTNKTIVLLAVIPFSLGSGFINPLLSSLISKLAGKRDRGGFLGLSASLGSLTRILSPIIGGYLIDYFGNRGPFVASLFLAAFSFLYFIFVDQKIYDSIG